MTNPTAAWDNLHGALLERCRAYRGMTTMQLVQAIVSLIDDAQVEYRDQETIAAVLQRCAAAGSIDAIALIAATGGPLGSIRRAIAAVAFRSDDVVHAMKVRVLADMIEQGENR